MDTVRWGILGCGDVTETKSGPGFQKARGSELVAVMRRNADLAESYAKRHGVPKWYSDADELIHDKDVDAVYIATRPDTHREYALRVARAGKPCYVEKPMGYGYREGSQMVDAFRSAGIPLFVAYYRRALDKYVAVKEMINKGEIGTVRFVRVTMQRTPDVTPGAKDRAELPWRLQREFAGGGLIMDVGSHVLDLLDFYFGPIVNVQGMASNQAGLYEVEDTVSGHWEFESGIHGVGVWCFVSYDTEDHIDIFGTEGQIRLSVLNVSEPVRILTDGKAREVSFDPPEHVQQPLIQTVVDHLRGVGLCPSTGESALRTDWVLGQLQSAVNPAGAG
ncbi:MAG: Gfo/Idh/MocA family protein [bacterium]